MSYAGSKAEKIVNNICRSSFLSLWSYANPLGKSFSEFMGIASQRKVRSRMMMTLSGVVYVFLAKEKSIGRKYRIPELGLRCFIARGSISNFFQFSRR